MCKTILSACLLLVVVFNSVSGSERPKKLGLLNYFAKYEHPDKRREKSYIKHLKKYHTQLEQLGHIAGWVDVDIFLSNRKAERDAYQRIIIPYHADWFTMEMYQGMLDYVRSGGLLITHSALLLVDEQFEYQCSGSKTTDFSRKSFLGVKGTGGSRKTAIKVIVENPLTKGFELNNWINVGNRIAGRTTFGLTANVAVLCKQIVKKKEIEGPFLSWKSTGKGACVYLVSVYYPKEESIDLLMRNILSEETLKWLCVQTAPVK